MSDDVWDQSAQSMEFDGLGIQKATDITSPAYISSVASSADLATIIVPENRLQETDTGLSVQWQNRIGLAAVPTKNERKSHATWTKMQAAQEAESILEKADVITRSRPLATFSTESAAWLSALPVATTGNLLDDTTLRASVGPRLGAEVCMEHFVFVGKW